MLRVLIGLADVAPLEGEAAELLTRIVAGAFVETAGIEDIVRESLVGRAARAKAYAA